MGATEREIAHREIMEKLMEKGDELCKRAIENVAETQQAASLSVNITLEPHKGEGTNVKATTKGRITLNLPQSTEHYNLDDQTRLED